MAFFKFIDSIANIGVKKKYEPWEIHLTRKLNLSSLLGVFNVFIGLIIFFSVGYHQSIFECTVVLVLSPFVFLLNIKYGYIPAMYLFMFIGCFLFFFLSVKLGVESFAFLYFFPLLIGLIQMIGRRETYLHLNVLFLFCIATIVAIILSYKYNVFQVQLNPEVITATKYINIFFVFFTSIGFMFIITNESIKQEALLKSALQQKEVLLAELFHRVKNNLNIVTSLLNLKKNSIDSKEAQNALEECRNMVFSMAMVHTKVYNSNKVDDLDLKDYLNDLAKELIHSIGGKDRVVFELKATAISTSITQAIPCGLIVNELITNAFKYAQVPEKKLCISLHLKNENGAIDIELRDNGPGRNEAAVKQNSLGMELIKSLSEQLEGDYYFTNNNGLQFNIKFKK